MYCSDKQFIDIALSTGVEAADLHGMLSTVTHLVQRRGSLVKTQQLQSVIADQSPEVAKMIQLLQEVDKIDVSSLKGLLHNVDSSGTSTFTVTGTNADRIMKKLENQFGDVDVELLTSEESELQIAGNGRWYKRSLAKDLDKVLS